MGLFEMITSRSPITIDDVILSVLFIHSLPQSPPLPLSLLLHFHRTRLSSISMPEKRGNRAHKLRRKRSRGLKGMKRKRERRRKEGGKARQRGLFWTGAQSQSLSLRLYLSLSSSSLSSLLSVSLLSMQQQRAIRLSFCTTIRETSSTFSPFLSPAIPTPDLFVITSLDWRNDSNEVSRVSLFSLPLTHSLPLLHYRVSSQSKQ